MASGDGNDFSNSPHETCCRSSVGRTLARGGMDWLRRTGSRVSAPNMRNARKLRRLYSEFVGPGDLCYDVGANIGDRTKVFLKLGARVVSIEPQSTCATALKKRFKNSDAAIVTKAVGDRPGFSELAVCERELKISTMSSRWIEEGRFSGYYESAKTEQVEVTTLDELIEEFGCPQFCKIDVEGYEKNVLKGLTKKMPCLCFEFTKEFLDDAEWAVEYLSELGRYSFNYAIDDSIVLADWVSPARLVESLRSSPDELLWGDIYARLH